LEKPNIKKSRTTSLPITSLIKQSKFVKELLEKLKKTEDFLKDSLEMLHNDIEILRKYEKNVDKEKILEIENLKLHKRKKCLEFKNDDACIKESFKYMYEMITWLQDFCIVTEIGCIKLVKSYKKENKLTDEYDLKTIEVDNAFNKIKELFAHIILDEKNIKKEIIEMYAERYTDKHLHRAKRRLHYFDYGFVEPKDKISIIILIIIMVLMFLSYFLLTYIPGNIIFLNFL